MIALISLAAAETAAIAIPCEGPTIRASVPEHGETDVAWDLAPYLVFDSCSPDDTVIVRLYEDEELVLEERVDSMASVHPWELDLALREDSAYHLRMSPSAGGEEVVIDWLTGSTRLVASDSGPIVEDVIEERDRGRGTLRVELDPGAQPNGYPALFELRSESGEVHSAVWQSEVDASVELRAVFEDDDRYDACVVGFQRHPGGDWIQGDTHCDDRVGCSTGGLGASLIAGLLAMLGVRRRR